MIGPNKLPYKKPEKEQENKAVGDNAPLDVQNGNNKEQLQHNGVF
jgi:hypothetical protein